MGRNKILRGKRTNVDFSEHELRVVNVGDYSSYYLKKPNSIIYSIKFICTSGITAVTGDLGNWIFCREFHPGKDEYVSDEYWAEKLNIGSVQKSHIFDPETTLEVLEQYIDENTGLENDLCEFLEVGKQLLINNGGDDTEYKEFMYNNLPNGYDFEDIPYEEKVQPRLNYVFDAFEEICSRFDK